MPILFSYGFGLYLIVKPENDTTNNFEMIRDHGFLPQLECVFSYEGNSYHVFMISNGIYPSKYEVALMQYDHFKIMKKEIANRNLDGLYHRIIMCELA